MALTDKCIQLAAYLHLACPTTLMQAYAAPEVHAEEQQQAQAQGGSVADEVAALNAEMCAQLDVFIDDSPEKKGR